MQLHFIYFSQMKEARPNNCEARRRLVGAWLEWWMGFWRPTFTSRLHTLLALELYNCSTREALITEQQMHFLYISHLKFVPSIDDRGGRFSKKISRVLFVIILKCSLRCETTTSSTCTELYNCILDGVQWVGYWKTSILIIIRRPPTLSPQFLTWPLLLSWQWRN